MYHIHFHDNGMSSLSSCSTVINTVKHHLFYFCNIIGGIIFYFDGIEDFENDDGSYLLCSKCLF